MTESLGTASHVQALHFNVGFIVVFGLRILFISAGVTAADG